MFNNRMRFGDIIAKQISGIAMGMSPAPTISNLYMAIYEEIQVLKFIPLIILYLRRFIDDGLGIWLHDPDPEIDERNWTRFQDCLNGSGLNWTFSERSQEVVFMDLRLTIAGKRIKSSLYAKPMTLHLYLPPHSCHAPGVLSGLIFGNILRIHQLCSNAKDVVKELKLFFHRLLDRGYQSNQLTPLFQQAIERWPCPLLKKLHGYLICASPKLWREVNFIKVPSFWEGSLVCPSLFLHLSCLWVKISLRLTMFLAHHQNF